MSAPSWRDVDPGTLEPVVLVAGGLLTWPGLYRRLAGLLRARGAADVVVAPVHLPDWALAAVRGLGPIATRVGRALLLAGEVSAASPRSRGAPILVVGHSAGGIVGRLLTSPVPFEGRRMGAGGRIGAIVTLGTPHEVGAEARWGRRVADAGVRFVNRNVPGAALAPTTGYLAVASRLVVGRRDGDGRARFVFELYEEIGPPSALAEAEGDGLVPVAAALLPGARHLVLDGAVHGPGVAAPWYGDEANLDAWWPAAVETWRDALRARLAIAPRPADGPATNGAAAVMIGAR